MKKKERNELTRLKNLVSHDKSYVGEDFEDLLIVDLQKLLKDYFDIKEGVKVEIVKSGDLYHVDFNFDAQCIKNFSYIPKEIVE